MLYWFVDIALIYVKIIGTIHTVPISLPTDGREGSYKNDKLRIISSPVLHFRYHLIVFSSTSGQSISG